MKKIYFIFFLVFFSSSLKAQKWLENLPQNKSESELTFFDYQNAFYSYWEPFNVIHGSYFVDGVKKKAVGWKQFKRWEYEMRGKINPLTGELPEKTAEQVYKEFYETQAQIKSTSVASWKQVVGDSTVGGYAGIGRVNSVAFHPTNLNRYWVGSAGGGLWETNNNGLSWTCLTDNIGSLLISDIIIPSDFSTSNTIYIATGDRDVYWESYSTGVLKSTNGGVTWDVTGLIFLPSDNKVVNKLLLDPSNNDVMLACTSSGIFKTMDGATNWSTQLTSMNFIDVEANSSDFTNLSASTTDGKIFNSVDGGLNWTNVFSNVDCRRIELAVSPDNPSWVYAVAGSNDSGLQGVYKSEDSGLTFLQVFDGLVTNMLGWEATGSDVGGQAWYTLTMAVSPFNANTVIIGGVNSWRSLDGGLTWSIINHWWGDGVVAVHADKHFQVFRQNGDLFECNDGGIYISTNKGTTWKDKSNGLVIGQMYKLGVSATNKDETITGLQDNGTKLLSGGKWFDVKGGDGMECIIDYENSDIQYGTYVEGQISRTVDHWVSEVEIQPADAGSGAWVTPYIIHPTEPEILYAGYSDVWKTTDSGNSWEKISSLGISTKITSMAIAPSNPNFLYVAVDNRIWKTTNGGSSWTIVTGNLPISSSDITAIAVKHDDENTLWVTLSGFNSNKVFQSSVGGTAWVNISTGLPPLPVNTIVQNKQSLDEVHLFVGTDFGVFFKKGTNDWVPFDSNLPNVKVSELEIYYAAFVDSSLLRAATYGRGLWETPIFISDSPMVGIADSYSHCIGNSNDLILVNYAGTIQWQQSSTGISDWINVTSGLGENTSVYTVNGLITTTYFRAEVSMIGLPPIYSNVVGLYLLPVVTMASIPKLCSIDSAFILTEGLPIGGVYSGEGVVGDKFDPSIVQLGSSIVTYTFSSSSECSSSVYRSVLVEDCNATKVFEGLNYLIYPNPAKGFVKIFYNNKEFVSIRLIDAAGKLVLTQDLSSSETEKNIDVSKYANGIYMIQLISLVKNVDLQLVISN